jgi:RNA polymerase sigma-70 factor (ECF subfamily)
VTQLLDDIAGVARGDPEALRALYRTTSAKLFGICLRILGDRGEAEDVLQEVYVTVWRKAHLFQPERGLSPMTWLAALARNKAIDRLRSRGRLRRADPLDAASEVRDPAASALEGLELDGERRRLERCLAELDERQSTAIRTAFFEGTSYPELADRLGTPLGTLKSWIRRGLLKLRTCLEP